MSVGVLSLQGSFHEHIAVFRRLGIEAIEVRKPEELDDLAGLIIPGGESTTMAKLAEQYNLISGLREFINSGRPIWGTCAGLIFLANQAVGQKKGGQNFLGGLDCTVHRNFFGCQLDSFETDLPVPALVQEEGGPPNFRAIFIRAPAILETGPSVQVLADYTVPSFEQREQGDQAEQKVIVAVKQGKLLATAFHPELTSDTRWHRYFLKMVQDNQNSDNGSGQLKNICPNKGQHFQSRDLPVFRETEHLSFEF